MTTLFRQEAISHQQESHEWGGAICLQPASVRILFWSALFATGTIIVFLSLAQYSRRETVQGFLSPTTGVARVLATRPGTVSEVHVAEGDIVRPGQPLLTIVSDQTTAGGQDVDLLVLDALQQQRELLSERIVRQPKRESDELAGSQARIAGLQQEIVHIEAQVAAQQQRIDLLQGLDANDAGLVKKGYLAVNEHARRQEAILEQKLTLGALHEQRSARRAAVAQERLTLDRLPDAMADQARELHAQLLEVKQRIAEADGDRAYTLQAPVGGTVSALQAFVGRSVEPQQLQVSLLPEASELQAQLYVPTRAAGFVRPGQEVRLLYDAFPYQRFGAQSGHILKVTKTILTDADRAAPFPLPEPAYKVTVALDAQNIDVHGEPVPLQADMLLRGDIILDRASLMTWLLDPLLSAGRQL